MRATGNLFHHRGPYIPKWSVEYHCARCDNTCRIWAPETEDLIETIVRAEAPEH